MADFKEATRRLLTIDSWLMAVCALLLYFSLEVTGVEALKHQPLGLVAEFVSIVGFIVALILYTLAASCLCSPYYETKVGKYPLSEEASMKKARILLVSGTIILFEGLAALIPLSLNFHPRAIRYTLFCGVAPIIWLILRKYLAFTKKP